MNEYACAWVPSRQDLQSLFVCRRPSAIAPATSTVGKLRTAAASMGMSDQLTLSNTRYRQQPHRSWEAALTGAEAPSGGAVWGEERCRRAGNTGTSHAA